MDLGGPADETYRYYYGLLLTAVAEHIKDRNDWYRALAYVKPSGMNLFSAENRLPNRCVDGPTPGRRAANANQCACNTQVWAEQGATSLRRSTTSTSTSSPCWNGCCRTRTRATC